MPSVRISRQVVLFGEPKSVVFPALIIALFVFRILFFVSANRFSEWINKINVSRADRRLAITVTSATSLIVQKICRYPLTTSKLPITLNKLAKTAIAEVQTAFP